MRKLLESVNINAPIDRVYEFLTTPMNLPAIWPNFEAVGNVTRHSDGRSSFDWTYRMAGLRIQGHSKALEARRNERLVTRSDRGLPATVRWLFERAGISTLVRVEVEYSVPGVFGPVAESVVAWMNAHDLELALANAKKALEIRPSLVHRASA